ncbi:Uncharacterised protein [Serratia fonticola]|nr:Uncharacterised protein [Serratia fonticola]
MMHPVVLNPRITACKDTTAQGPCSRDVAYAIDGTTLSETPATTTPDKTQSKVLTLYGMHCDLGSRLTNTPFSKCFFTNALDHTPGVTNCNLISTDTWELTPASTCAPRSTTWGYHHGAGPGGECLVIAQDWLNVAYELHTIHGLISADTAANSGSTFCQKFVPPDVPCEILLPGEIDHGIIPTDMVDMKTVTGGVKCGPKPVLSVVGGSKVTIAPGLTTDLSFDISEGGIFRATSSLRAVKAVAGTYSRAVVVQVSPY